MKIPPLAITMICFLIAWLSSVVLPHGVFDAGVIIPAVLAFPGIIFLLLAILHFHAMKTTVNPLDPATATSLVTTGVFSVSRNPMYLGMAILLFAYAIYLGALSALLAPLLFVVWITPMQILPEEKALTEIFGDDYRKYQKKTRRWL